MKILVTGGAGFIGSHIVDAYTELGQNVAVLDNFSGGNNVRESIKYFDADINDRFRVYEIFDVFRPEVVSHHAALCSVRGSDSQKLHYAETNVLGTCNVLQASVKFGVKKFIFASSGGACYGEMHVRKMWKEYDYLNPIDVYGKTKDFSEKQVDLYSEMFGLAYVILRYSNVYGPRQRATGESGVISRFVDDLLNGIMPVVNGDGSNVRDFVYVSDVVEANLLALSINNSLILNVGTGIGTSVLEVLELVCDAFGRDPEYIVMPVIDSEVRRNVLNCDLAKSFGWKPKVLLETGIEKLAEYRKEHL